MDTLKGFLSLLALLACVNAIAVWGYNDRLQLSDGTPLGGNAAPLVDPDGVITNKTIVSFCSNRVHSIIVTTTGVYTLGNTGNADNNNKGQLGVNSTIVHTTPKPITISADISNKTIVDAACGGAHSLLLSSDGQVFAFGDNTYGQLGDNTLVAKYVATAVISTGKIIKQIQAADRYSILLATDGTVYVIGSNTNGNICMGSSAATYKSPTQISTSLNFTSVSASSSFTLLQTTDTSLYMCGLCLQGQCGLGTGTSFVYTPTRLFNGLVDPVLLYVAGGSHGVAVLQNQGLLTWGSGSNGQQGTGDSYASNSYTPHGVTDTAKVLVGKTITSVQAGYTSTCLLVNTGDVYCYGSSAQGNNDIGYPSPIQDSANYLFYNPVVKMVRSAWALMLCADGKLYTSTPSYTSLSKYTPGPLVDRNNLLYGKIISQIALGNQHALFLTSEGNVYSTGANTFGQLGIQATSVYQSTPIAINDTLGVLTGRTVSGVYAGYYHSVLVLSDGKVATFGHNDYFQLGTGTGSDKYTPVMVVDSGNVIGTRKVVMAAPSASTTVLLCDDGTVVGFGYDGFGQLAQTSSSSFRTAPVKFLDQGNVLVNKTVVAIASMDYTTLLLTSDGTVATVGSNSYGNLGIGMTPDNTYHYTINTVGVPNVTQIATGSRHAMLLTTDGNVYTFGQSGFAGCLGTDSSTKYNLPYAINDTKGVFAGGKKIIKVATSSYNSFLVRDDYKVFSCGSSTSMGDGTGLASNIPTPMIDPNGLFNGLSGITFALGGQSDSMMTTGNVSFTPHTTLPPTTTATPVTTTTATPAPTTTTVAPTTTVSPTSAPTTTIAPTTTKAATTTTTPMTTTKSPTTTSSPITTASPTTTNAATTTKAPTTSSPGTTSAPTMQPPSTTQSPTTFTPTTSAPTTSPTTTTPTTSSPTTYTPGTTSGPVTTQSPTTGAPTTSPSTTTESPTQAPTTTTTAAPTSSGTVVINVAAVVSTQVTGDSSKIPTPTTLGSAMIFTTSGASTTVSVTPQKTEIPTGSGVQQAFLSFSITQISTTVQIRVTMFDASGKEIANKIVTVSATGTFQADITSLLIAAKRSLRQVVVNGQQVSFGLTAVTPDAAVAISPTVSMSLQYAPTTNAPESTMNLAIIIAVPVAVGSAAIVAVIALIVTIIVVVCVVRKRKQKAPLKVQPEFEMLDAVDLRVQD
jgi:alpha-tubulin suppressor-like RCC1 family protein